MQFSKILYLLISTIFIINFSVYARDIAPTSIGSCISQTLIPGIDITFSGAGSHDNDTQGSGGETAEKWEWNFNYDHNRPWSYDVSSTGIEVEWEFTSDGPYVVAVLYYDDDGTAGNIYTFQLNIKGMRRAYYVKDHLGSVRMTIDENGEVVSAQDYHPYGEILRSINNSSVNEKYKFTEKERDTETNYDYFGARYLNSEIGRWNSVDPLADQYPGMSPYNYCVNNPLKYIDPDGMDTLYFNSSGTYDPSKTKKGGKHVGYVLDDDGNTTITLFFNDGDDVQAFDDGTLDGINLEFLKDIEKQVEEGVGSPSSIALVNYIYAAYESPGKTWTGSKMDFYQNFPSTRSLYLYGKTAYNAHDAGNYLWGRGMSKLNIPLIDALSGANAFESLRGNGKDHPSDQRAIIKGYFLLK